MKRGREEYKFYGRRTARPLRPIDRERLADKERFACDLSTIKPGTTLEIGFGNGEHLLKQVLENPDKQFIGADPYVNGQAKLLRGIEEHNLQNIAVYTEDVRYLLDELPDACLDQVYILFPDPWPKTRHHKRRIVQVETLQKLERLCENGALLYIASDVPDYITHVFYVLDQYNNSHKTQWRWTAKSTQDWKTPFPFIKENSAFYARAVREGRTSTFLELQLVK